MERMCLMKVAACINCKTEPNSEGSVTEKSQSNKFCEYYENSKGLNWLIAILDL